MSCAAYKAEHNLDFSETDQRNDVIMLSAAGISGNCKAEAFLKNIIMSQLSNRFKFIIILPVNSTLLDICKLNGVIALPVDENRDSLTDALKTAMKQHAITAVHAHSSLDHLAAVTWRKKYPQVFIIATWYDYLKIENSSGNRDLYCNSTAVNMFLDATLRDSMHSKVPDGCVKLANPMLIHQPNLGPQNLISMLEHCYLSLLHPNREHEISGNKRSYYHIKLSYITHFYCNQQNISSVYSLLEKYAGYPADILDHVHFVIVDDGSPITYETPQLNLNITWVRICDNIPWNQSGARNVGALYAKSDNIIMLDLDHEIPAEAMRQLVKRPSCGKRLYKMYRESSDGTTVYSGHPNLFFMSRGRFFELFGYDEEFSGNYGAEDFRFVKYHKACGTLQTYLPKRIRCRERTDIDRSRSYHSLSRDLSFNTPVDSRKKMEIANYGHGAGHSRMFLGFNWEIFAEHCRTPVPKQALDRCWKYFAIVRQILPRF
jgi:glycosyltransferase involved in cell wall biosynthesis